MLLETGRNLFCVGALTLALAAVACSRQEPPPAPQAAPQPLPPPPPPAVRDAAVDVVDGGGDAADAGAGRRRGGKKPATSAPTGGGGVKVDGPLPKADAEQAVRGVSAKLRACYDQARATQPALKGRVTFKLTINERGFVTVAEIVTSTLQGGSDAENCMVRAARDFRFPRAAGESTISFAMTFGR